jgi:6-phosphogluconolactonase
MFQRGAQPEALLWILEDAGAVAREAARRFVAAAGRAVEGSAPFRVALAGGRTPLPMYRLLAGDDAFRHSVHWPSVEFFWGDERFVPAEHPESNFRAAREALLGPLGIDPARVHPIPTGARDAEAAAAAYEALLHRAFATAPPRVPRFDLVLLGLGSDGHTASLFPGALPALDPGRLAAAARNPADGSPRVTLTPAILGAAREILFLVSGEAKAAALERAMRAAGPDPAIPATLIRPDRRRMVWLADRAAAARIVEPSGGGKGDGR